MYIGCSGEGVGFSISVFHFVSGAPPFTGLEGAATRPTVQDMETEKRRAVRIRPKTRAGAAHRAAVFTSIDGTLLDARTFDAGASRAAVRRLLAAGVPVIPVSVMTLDEIAPVAKDLGLQHAMIVEAGGAIARWTGNGWEVEACGPPAETLLDVVLDIENRSGVNLLVYSALGAEEASRLSGRTGEMLEASTHRCFSEPFVIETGDLEDVKRAAAEIGFSVRRGRRFLHLCRAFDEGEAFARLRQELQCNLAIGIGGAAVDAEFLMRTDVAIIVPGPDGEPDPELAASVPDARIAPAPGPAGWAAAMDEIWQSLSVAKQDARGA
jgi:mannosyl-3-phosphoglycerate phosphatase